jgi:CHAT domain
VLCPFGFWGFAHVLEVPEPPPNRDLDAVICYRFDETSALAGAGGSLDKAALDAHVRRLREIPGFADQTVITTARELRDALAASTMDIVYLLCHAERVASSAVVAPTMRLEFTDRCVTSDDIASWSRDEWDVRHWSDRRPLVILNACQTSEIVQSSMATFVSNFVGAGASGVIGSETLLEQGAAARAMEVFLREFCAGAPVGAAVRTMRWELLATGSLLGLAYTSYCSADLRLRDHRSQPSLARTTPSW